MVIPSEQSVKGYDLLERIGEGAYGSVFRAYQPHMRREVAIKIIRPRYANQPDFIRRFDLEAHLVAQLEHLHIVPLYDYWREPDGAYLVMRLMKGGSLEKSLLNDGPWEAERAARLVDQIASALDAAHQQGVVHRDLKPANILLDEQGNAYLSDFGIAKELERGKTFTQTGAIVGTPAYITPEQVQSQPVTPQTDIYTLGVVAYELLAGGHPFLDTPSAELVIKHLKEPLPLVQDRRPELTQDVDRVIQQATAKDPLSRYEDALALAVDFRRALQLEVEAPGIPESEIYNPYKGLRQFQEADADDFYGREILIKQLLVRMEELHEASRFLAVVGPSGSGKSSVVKAGLVPALRRGAISGSEVWFISEMKPGTHPLEELELAILSVAVIQPPSLLGQIKEDTRGLLRAVRRVLPEGSEMVLVIDQLEELFTLVNDPAETKFFLESIHEAVSDAQSPIRVLATLRADFYDRPLRYPGFSTLMESRTQIVKPLSAGELEQAISEPAAKIGVEFESGLASVIVGEVHDELGALPMLQYALTELFERREGRLISKIEYDNIGGVRGALARRAEEIYSELDDNGQEASRQLLLRLVTLGEGEEDSRRRVLISEVKSLHGEASPEVMDLFGKARLLTFDHDPSTREPTVEVAHEALLQEWGRLRDWLDESRADIRLQRVLGNAANEWQSADRDPGFLLRGSRLDQFEGWMENSNLVLTQLEADFIQASQAERIERESIETKRLEHEAALERRSRNSLRIFAAVLAVAAVVAAILSGVAFNQRSIAQSSAATATYAQGQAIIEAATAVAAQDEAQQLALSEAQARQEAEEARRISAANELVAFALREIDNPTDVSYSLALLLAREAVQTTMRTGEPATPGGEDALRRAIASAPIQRTSFEGHEGSVNYASWSPDGTLIATASEDGTARVWDAQSGEELHVFRGHAGGVKYASWSPDGKKILTSGDDSSVRIWDVISGEQARVLEGHNLTVGTANWSADQTQILSASIYEIKMWDTRTGEVNFDKTFSQSSEVSTGSLNFAQLSPMGDQIATQFGNTIVIIDSHDEEEVFRYGSQFGVSNSAAWSSDGNLLLSAHDLGSAVVWDTQANEPIMDLRHSARVEQAAWNPDESLAATVTQDGSVHIWDIQSGRLLHKWSANISPLLSIEWSPDGDRVLTAGADGVVRIWEIGTSGQGQSLEHNNLINTAGWNPDGRFIFSASGVDTYIWDVESGQTTHNFRGHSSPVFAAAWEPSGERIASGDANGSLIIWDPNTAEKIKNIQAHNQSVLSIAWDPGGQYLLTGSQDRVAKIWDIMSGKEILSLPGHSGGVQSGSWSPDKKWIITTSADNTAIIWDAGSGKEKVQLVGHTGSVNDAAWSQDGKQVVTASNDRSIRLWDVKTGQELHEFIGHNGAVLSVDWKPGGGNIASSSADRTARIWDSSTGIEVSKISGHADAVTEVRWSPDGSQIMTASTDRTIRIWPVGIEGLLDLADSLILRDPPEFTTEERCLYLHECGE